MNVSGPLKKLAILSFALTIALPVVHAATEVGNNAIPDDAYGVVLIEKPSAGALPFLFGLKGEGRYVTRNKHGELCEVAPVPLVAGGFSGRGIEKYTEETVRIAIYNQQVSQRLQEGKRIVSGDYTFSLNPTDESVDIQILSGLSRAEGFVLHPKRRWFAWVNSETNELNCEVIARKTDSD